MPFNDKFKKYSKPLIKKKKTKGYNLDFLTSLPPESIPQDNTRAYNFLLLRKSNEFSSMDDLEIDVIINKLNENKDYFINNLDKFKKLKIDYIYKCPLCKGIHDGPSWKICEFCGSDFS